MSDKFIAGLNERVDSPAYDAVAVTPHDSTNLTTFAKALYVGMGGDVSLVTLAGNTVVFKNVPDGKDVPVRCKRVNATGTTASDIVAYL